jgi:hypothetical protein
MRACECDSFQQSKVSFSIFDIKLQPDASLEFKFWTVNLNLINKISMIQGIRSQYFSTFCWGLKEFLQSGRVGFWFLHSA